MLSASVAVAEDVQYDEAVVAGAAALIIIGNNNHICLVSIKGPSGQYFSGYSAIIL